jgi:cell division septum initiation protein DivIVA
LSEAAALDENKALRRRVQELEQEIEMLKIENAASSSSAAIVGNLS